MFVQGGREALSGCCSTPFHQSPTSEGEEEELLLEEEEEDVLAGVSSEDKGHRHPGKGSLEPGEGPGHKRGL